MREEFWKWNKQEKEGGNEGKCVVNVPVFVQMSGRVSRTSSAVRTTAACPAAGSATTTTIAGTTRTKTSVVGHPPPLLLFFPLEGTVPPLTRPQRTVISNTSVKPCCKQTVPLRRVLVVSAVPPVTLCLCVYICSATRMGEI